MGGAMHRRGGRRPSSNRLDGMTVCLDRRRFLKTLALAGAAAALPAPLRLLAQESASGPAAAGDLLRKAIPTTGETVTAVGMGTWLTFDALPLGSVLDRRVEILRRFFAAGGEMIDSSPMYGQAEAMVGECLESLDGDDDLFSATKVWTPSQWHGRRQLATSEELWGDSPLDLYQVHNLVAWEDHLETLRQARADGRIRYLGVTTSHGRRHGEMERVVATQAFDFVQLTYNIVDREVEERLLPQAADLGRAVIANRPFRGGSLIDRLEGAPVPDWAATEIGCRTWPQFLLKWIVSHPAVTAAIPATSDPDHMTENMVAARGPLPDAALRRRMVETVQGLL